jgi:FHS family L-fucose permease-like MFS transporter
MVGRFIGSALLQRVRAGRMLAFNAMVAALLVVIAVLAHGQAAMWTILSIGLFNSIMFPTIFTLAIAGLGRHTGQGSGILCMAIVGGAILPVAVGKLADTIGLQRSFVLPALCYLYIAYYGWKGSAPVRGKAAEAPAAA